MEYTGNTGKWEKMYCYLEAKCKISEGIHKENKHIYEAPMRDGDTAIKMGMEEDNSKE